MPREQLQTMADRWERLAQKNARHFIATSKQQWNDEAFFATGRDEVAAVMRWVNEHVPNLSRGRMLEIGCGLGRLTASFAEVFARADGVDIAAAMIEQAKSIHRRPNIFFEVVAGNSLDLFPNGTFDLAYCGLVFQHIPDDDVIRSYLTEIARVLSPGGIAVAQFDTRPENMILKAYKSLPDALLPPHHRRYIRRYRRDSQQVRAWIAASGLRILAEKNADAAEHYFMIQRNKESRSA